MAGRSKPGDVVVIRYEGPHRGPGMQEMLSPTSALIGMGLGDKVALITDGRFSGARVGLASAMFHQKPPARGPIAPCSQRMSSTIDLEARSLDVCLSDEEIQRRLADCRPLIQYPEPVAAALLSFCDQR